MFIEAQVTINAPETAVWKVITDIEKAHDKKIARDLKKIPHTIRFRVLY